MTSIVLLISIGTDGYKSTSTKELFISLGDLLHSYASSKNDSEFKTLCLILFQAGCIVFTKYFEVLYVDDPVADTHGTKFFVDRFAETGHDQN